MARVKRDPNDLPIPEKILNAASALFARMGYDNTPMSAIAEDAGITPGALYYHFNNKQDILYQTLERAVSELCALCIAAVEKADSPTEKLRAFVETDIKFELDNLQTIAPMYTGVVYGARRRDDLLTSKQLERLRGLELKHLDTLRSILRAGMQAGVFAQKPVTLTAFAIIGICEHIANWANLEGPMSAAELGRYFADQAQLIAEQPNPASSLNARAARPKRHPAKT